MALDGGHFSKGFSGENDGVRTRGWTALHARALCPGNASGLEGEHTAIASIRTIGMLGPGHLHRRLPVCDTRLQPAPRELGKVA